MLIFYYCYLFAIATKYIKSVVLIMKEFCTKNFFKHYNHQRNSKILIFKLHWHCKILFYIWCFHASWNTIATKYIVVFNLHGCSKIIITEFNWHDLKKILDTISLFLEISVQELVCVPVCVSNFVELTTKLIHTTMPNFKKYMKISQRNCLWTVN